MDLCTNTYLYRKDYSELFRSYYDYQSTETCGFSLNSIIRFKIINEYFWGTTYIFIYYHHMIETMNWFLLNHIIGKMIYMHSRVLSYGKCRSAVSIHR